MAENRETILANFQTVTAIDDIALAIFHLETSNWNLETAIHLALQEDIEDIATPAVTYNTNNVDMHEPHSQLFEPASIQNNIDAGPSTSSSYTGDRMRSFDSKPPQEVTFHVHFNSIVHTINISSSMTVDDLKMRIVQKTHIPVCRQLLKGWLQSTEKEAQNGSTVLRNLNLSKDNNLFMTDLRDESFTDDNNVMFVSEEQPPPTYRLDINFLDESRTISLNFPGSKTIQEVKNGIYAVTDVPVRYQNWKGWPGHTTNSMRLSDTGIDYVHQFELSREGGDNKETNNKVQDLVSDSSEGEEEFEDATEDLNADDDIFSESPAQSRMRKHLIEDLVDDEIIGCLQFIENYRERYGPGPQFYEGSLENAVKTACSRQAKDRKLLAIYLHHDRSVSANLFCVQILNNENMIRLLTENFVIYGWDLTCESNKNMFLSSMTACVGDAASLQIRNTPIIQLPAIIIIRKQRSSIEVENVIHGNVSLDELYIQLMRNSDEYKEQLKVEIREEEERFAREMVKMEQDAAYRESLEADRAKEMAKQQKEQMIANERKRLESEHAEAEAKKEAIRKEAENTLPPEPDSSSTELTKIRFRKPTGEFMERKFTQDTKLQILLNFSTANGFPVSDYKIISSFPRRDLTSMDPEETLKSLKLYPQETVMLEERH